MGRPAAGKKSNGITAIPQLLDTIDIKGDTVTVDAMACRREIARKIRRKGAGYVLTVKENHPAPRNEIAECFTAPDAGPRKNGQRAERESGYEKDHGGIEQRKITVTGAKRYEDGHLWYGLKTFIRYRCARQTVDKTAGTGWKTTEYDRYYPGSLGATPERFGYPVRRHRSLDAGFAEDASQVRKDHAPENLDILRKIVLRLLRSARIGRKRSAGRKQFIAAPNQDFLYDKSLLLIVLLSISILQGFSRFCY